MSRLGLVGAPHSVIAPRRLVGRLGLERGVGKASGRSLLAASPQGGRPASLDIRNLPDGAAS